MEQLNIYDFLNERLEEKEDLKLLELKKLDDFKLDLDSIIGIFSTSVDLDSLWQLDLELTNGRIDYVGSGITSKTYQHLDSIFKMGAYEEFFKTNWMNGEEIEFLEKYGIESNYLEYYKPTNQVDVFKTFPIINYKEPRAKMKQTIIIFVNHLFKYFDKKEVNREIVVDLPEQLIENFVSVLNLFPEKDTYKEILEEEDYPLYKVFQPLVESLRGYLGSDKFDMEIIEHYFARLGESGDREGHLFRLENNQLIFNTDEFTFSIVNVNRSHLMYKLAILYNTFIYVFFINDVYEKLLGLTSDYDRKKSLLKMSNLTEEKHSFIEKLNMRRVPIEEVPHKTAVNAARKMGITHFVKPFLNDIASIEIGTPLYVLKNNQGEYFALPPTDVNIDGSRLIGVKDYVGYYDNYPEIATRAAPLIVGDNEMLNVSINEELFHNVLINHYKDWEHYDEFVKTMEILEKYPLVKNRMFQDTGDLELFDADAIFDGMFSVTSLGEEFSEFELNELPNVGDIVRLSEDDSSVYTCESLTYDIEGEELVPKLVLKDLSTDELVEKIASENTTERLSDDEVITLNQNYYIENELRLLEECSRVRNSFIIVDSSRHEYRVYWNKEIAYRGDFSDLEGEITSRQLWLDVGHATDSVSQRIKEDLENEDNKTEIFEGILFPFALEVYISNSSSFDLRNKSSFDLAYRYSTILIEN